MKKTLPIRESILSFLPSDRPTDRGGTETEENERVPFSYAGGEPRLVSGIPPPPFPPSALLTVRLHILLLPCPYRVREALLHLPLTSLTSPRREKTENRPYSISYHTLKTHVRARQSSALSHSSLSPRPL